MNGGQLGRGGGGGVLQRVGGQCTLRLYEMVHVFTLSPFSLLFELALVSLNSACFMNSFMVSLLVAFPEPVCGTIEEPEEGLVNVRPYGR